MDNLQSALDAISNAPKELLVGMAVVFIIFMIALFFYYQQVEGKL